MNIKWEEGADAPVRYQGHRAVWLNGLVYVYENSGYTIDCYDPVNNLWISPITTSNRYFAMTTLNSKLIMAGGIKKSHYLVTNQIFIMDVGRLKKYTKMKTARKNATANGYQGMLIITGGQDTEGSALSTTELFDSIKGQWYKCDNLPQPFYLLKSVINDNILYLFEGITRGHVYSYTIISTPLDNLSSHQLKWNTGTLQDVPRYYPAPVSVCGTQLLMVGGNKMINNDEATITSDVHKFNKGSHNWEAIGHIPLPRNSSVAVGTDDNRIIVIGGRGEGEGYASTTVWIGSFEPQ